MHGGLPNQSFTVLEVSSFNKFDGYPVPRAMFVLVPRVALEQEVRVGPRLLDTVTSMRVARKFPPVDESSPVILAAAPR